MKIIFFASFNCRSEYVPVLPVVISELELGNIERHIFPAHFVECADDTALENRPEAFDGLSMDCTDDIFAPSMVHSGVRIFAVKTLVTSPLVCAEQAYFVRDCLVHESFQCGGLDVRDYTRDHIALAADCADDWSFAGTNATSSAAPAAFIPMPILGEAANESFIDFDWSICRR